MAIEFLDEVQERGSPSRSTLGGVEWLPAPSASGVEFTDDKPEPASASEVARRFLDPAYEPTLAEFKIYQAARKARSVGQHVADDLSLVGSAVAGLWDTVVGGVKGAGKFFTDIENNDPIVTTAEAVARGTMRDLELAKKLLPSELFGGGTLNFDQFAATKLATANEQKFRYHPLTPENSHTQLTLADVPPEVLSQWRKEYDEQFVPQSGYEKFLAKRQETREQIKQAGSKVSVLSGREAPINPAVAEAGSLVASPLAVVPFGKALTPAKTITRALAAKTLEGAGKTFEWVGEKTVQAGTLPERAAGAVARAASGSDEAATKATQTVAQGVAGISFSPVKLAGKTIGQGGSAAEAAGRAIASGPSRFSVFERISKDAQAPQWLRRVANVARPAGPAVSLAGAAGKGATEGAAIGTVLGGLADGEEGAASGFGAGLALGAGGGLLGRIAGRGQYRAGLEDMDIARWLAAKPEAEVQNIRNLNLSREQALTLADTERLARGVVEPGQTGDVEFRYLNDKEFSQLFGVGKGAQTIAGDRPVVFVNTGYKGPRSVFHETLHALDALEGSAPQRQALNRILFDQTLPDGQVVSRGIYSAADVAEFTNQYRSRLNEAARAEFDLLTPEDRQQRIMAEVRSESFANLMAGRTGGASVLASRGLRGRVTDALLTADHTTMLGKMRRALEGVGVRFDASGAPSELFVRNGKPITNTPAVDAALRDYLRAKDQLTRKLTANEDEEAPSLVVRPQDLVSKGNAGLISTFKDHDIFAKNPDGSVKMLGGVPVLLSEREIRAVQAKRVDAMIEALVRTPNIGEAGVVKLKENGAWEGKFFSEKQLAAMDALPDDVLSPSMKSKLRELSKLAQSDGQQIILDYNAALKGGKYSSGIAPTTRAAVPLTFNISKAGNFYMTTLDTSHFFRKLGEWRNGKPRAFDAWNGDVDAFLRDSFAYLDNHVNGRPGSVNLDTDPAVAVNKKNVINDFFNVPKGAGNEDLNPVQLSTRGNKDNLIRSRRFDRINRITPGAGDRFPIRYDLQKRNFMPASELEASLKKNLRNPHTLFSVMAGEAQTQGIAEGLAADRGDVSVFLTNARSGSTYVTLTENNTGETVKIRYADHFAPGGGGFRVTDMGSGRESPPDFNIVKNKIYSLEKGKWEQINLDKLRWHLENWFPQRNANAPVAGGAAGIKTPSETQSQSAGRISASVENPRGPAVTGAQAQADKSNVAAWQSEEGSALTRAMSPQSSKAVNVNFLPAVSPVAIQKQIRAQTQFDLASKVPAPPALGQWLAAEYFAALDRKLNRGSRLTRTEQLQRVKEFADQASPQEMATALAIMMSRGRDGAKAHVEQMAVLKSAAEAMQKSLLKP